jgi:hypothetical protein
MRAEAGVRDLAGDPGCRVRLQFRRLQLRDVEALETQELCRLRRERGREQRAAAARAQRGGERLGDFPKSREVGERLDLGGLVEQQRDRPPARFVERGPQLEERLHGRGALGTACRR